MSRPSGGKWACVFGASLLMTGCAGPARSERVNQIGMCVQMIGADSQTIEREFDLLSAMNVGLIRTDFDWSAVEGERGRFDWSYPDRMVQEARDRKIDILPVLAWTPGWARSPGSTTHEPPARIEDFADFARAAAKRYAPLGVRRWEIWNEPNSSKFWEPLPNPDRYGELFRAAASAIRSVDPGAEILTAGLTRGTSTPDGKRISQQAFLTALYRNGSAQLASAIAIHPYTFPALPWAADPVKPGGLADLPAVHGLMEAWGDGHKKIWITEYGAPTGTAPEAMTEAAQLASIVQAREMVHSWDWAGPLIYFELRDSGTSKSDIEQNFGVFHADLSPKKAGSALVGPA